MAWDYGVRDMAAVQAPHHPLVYKTHFFRPHCPKGAGKYLFITRDPLDAGPSFFYFLQAGQQLAWPPADALVAPEACGQRALPAVLCFLIAGLDF